MIVLNMVVTLLAGATIAVGLWGFRASLVWGSNRAAFWLSWALLLLSVKFMVRGILWDIVLPLAQMNGEHLWVEWLRENRASVNMVFAIAVFIGGLFIHLSLYWSIPDEQRPLWTRWNAWRHPKGARKRRFW